MERHVDLIARTLGVDPLELRKKNLLRIGDTTATGQLLGRGSNDDPVAVSGRLAKQTVAHGPAHDKHFEACGGRIRAHGSSVFP